MQQNLTALIFIGLFSMALSTFSSGYGSSNNGYGSGYDSSSNGYGNGYGSGYGNGYGSGYGYGSRYAKGYAGQYFPSSYLPGSTYGYYGPNTQSGYNPYNVYTNGYDNNGYYTSGSGYYPGYGGSSSGFYPGFGSSSNKQY